MARYAGDMNKVVLIHESGTYASPSGSGNWIGQVTSNSITDNENKLIERHMGTESREISSVENGPLDVEGTLTYNMQDQRLPFWAIGSVAETESGGTYEHTAVSIATNVKQSPFTSGALNPPISFTLEDSKQAPGTGRNFIREINGTVIDTVTLTSSQGDKNTCEISYLGKTTEPKSGASTVVTERTEIPYLWSHTSLDLNGSPIRTPTEVSLEIARNATSPHYVNNERAGATPHQDESNYTLNVTLDLDSNDAMMLYDWKKNNTKFNGVFDMNADSASTGSQHTIYTLSGCYITEMDPPSESTGISSTDVTIRPTKVTGKAYDQVQYNPF